VVWGYYGRTDWADWADGNGFLGAQCTDFKQKKGMFHFIAKVVYILKKGLAV
jgi:hypothetical protein